MSSLWRPLPPQHQHRVLTDAEPVAPFSAQVPGNGSHSDPSNESEEIQDPENGVDEGEGNCCCRTPRCRCSARTGLFAVQCSACFKWRLMPSKRVYEDIRQTVLVVVDPFVCEKAKKWNPRISCDFPDDILPSDDMIWGTDDPVNAPDPPPGWERLLRIGNHWWKYRFADVGTRKRSGGSCVEQ